MTDFQIVPRQEIGRQAWDAFVDASDEAWLWHRYDLQDALAIWPGYQDSSFAVLDPVDKKILAVVSLHLVEWRLRRLFPWKTLESLGGPACVNNLGVVQQHRILKCVTGELTVLARRRKAVEINISLCPMAPAYRGERCPRINPLISMGYENTLGQTWVVDLRQAKDVIWAHFEKRARTAVRKAEKMGVHIRPADSESDLETYYNLHCETYQRTGAQPHPRAYFESIWWNFLANGISRIWIAEHEGVPVSAENFGFYKNAVIYWTGVSSQRGLELQANSLIQWTAIQQMVDEGFIWYETGEAFPGAEGKKKGLNDFKQSFGGVIYPLYRGKMLMMEKLHYLKKFLTLLAGADD